MLWSEPEVGPFCWREGSRYGGHSRFVLVMHQTHSCGRDLSLQAWTPLCFRITQSTQHCSKSLPCGFGFQILTLIPFFFFCKICFQVRAHWAEAFLPWTSQWCYCLAWVSQVLGENSKGIPWCETYPCLHDLQVDRAACRAVTVSGKWPRTGALMTTFL